jgi:transposase-like protein
MSDDYQRIELVTGTARRRRWTTEQKLRIIEASCEPWESVSSVAPTYGYRRVTALVNRVLAAGASRRPTTSASSGS